MTNIAENDQLRSEYIWQMLQKSENNLLCKNEIPAIIIHFWNDREIPSDVFKCLESWSILEKKGFQRYIFNDQSAEEFIISNYTNSHLKAFKRCIHPAMRADYFRLCFLVKEGGVYIDADNELDDPNVYELFFGNKLKVQPLCYNISTDSMENIEIAREKDYQNNLIYYVNNDPLLHRPIILF